MHLSTKLTGWPDPSRGALERFTALLEDTPSDQSVAQEDREVFAAVLAICITEWLDGRGTLPDLVGLDRAALVSLKSRYFPRAPLPNLDFERSDIPKDQEAIALLLRWRGGGRSVETSWLADILARRAREPNHLWQDLGLPSRQDLGKLMGRHFPRLVALNTKEMRWKKFLYRQICGDSDLAVCLSPTCEACEEYDICFSPESGEARL